MFSSVWQTLNHESVLKAVETTLGEKLSSLVIQRNSYINRVYELEKFDSRERLIAKFYRPDRWTTEMIAEEHRFLFDLAAKEIPVVPPQLIDNQSLFMLPTPDSAPKAQIPYSLFPKKSGRALDEFDQNTWEELGRLLARIHLVGATHKESQRITWRPAVATRHHLAALFKTNYLLPDFRPSFEQAAESFIKKAEPQFTGLEFILLHGDCHKGNFVHRPGEGNFIVDFDDMCFGPPIQDLWMLLPGTPEKSENELGWFFKGYETFRQFDRSSLGLVPLLRGMRLVHFASWLAVQSQEQDFSKHFPEAGTKRYWNELIKELFELAAQI